MSDSTANRPFHVIRRKGVKASIFVNRSAENEFTKVTVQKIYRDEGGNWKTTSSFSRDDLPLVSLVTERAWEWILGWEEQGKPSASSSESRSWSESTGRSN